MAVTRFRELDGAAILGCAQTLSGSGNVLPREGCLCCDPRDGVARPRDAGARPLHELILGFTGESINSFIYYCLYEIKFILSHE